MLENGRTFLNENQVQRFLPVYFLNKFPCKTSKNKQKTIVN